MAKVSCLLRLFLLIFSFEVFNAVNADCNYMQKIEPGKTYYVYNPSYPNNYAANVALSCRWTIFSDTGIRISCNLDMPASPNCEVDALSVYTDPSSAPGRYCGSGNFSQESTGKEMIITLTVADNTTGGRFLCELQAIGEDTCSCGWKNPTRIVGGRETGVNEYSMMSGIMNVSSQQIYCGGTIISPKHILTAASCINNLIKNSTTSLDSLGIIVGDHDRTSGSETNATKLYRIDSYVVYPSYIPNKNDYNIAVITIVGTITYTNKVGPACLPFQHQFDSFGGAYVDLLGWGLTEFAGAMSNTLQEVSVSVINFLPCKSYYPNLEYRQMCTYTDGKDACQFDTGGPIIWENPTTRNLILVGIIGFGNCANDEPTLHTRVGSYVDWITSVTKGVSLCHNE